ncbi:MAG: ATP-binding cassette domain-containing protein [Oscillospiraceae bacterium]|nr:ATP-binding cassette domain-containing protein [Oscillospiraceae bacterium]MDY4105949.1 ATP-binding cassette domain-containing protein [Oscillospiraceae bacterium]
MITVENLTMQFAGTTLFSKVDLQFTAGNCYGIIGANGAGKSTFIKILSGELEPTSGHVYIDPKARMSVLKQNQFLYDEYTVMDTVIMGNQRLYDCGKEKDAIYMKEDFTDEDGLRAAELEEEFAELGGWEAESDASKLLQGLGISPDMHETMMSDMDPRLKFKVLLAQALFGHPDIILLDEPTNNLDLASVVWLEDFLMDYEGTVLVVSHDRYFLNNVCTHIVDIDYGKIKMYVGNYDFWYESSQLMQRLMKDQNKKAEQKIEELQSFIRRFSANKSKSRQATSRRKLLDKLTVEEMPASSRRYPWVGFQAQREPGKDRLFVTEISKTVDGVKLLNNVSFIMNKEDKIAILGRNELAVTMLFKILMGEEEPDSGSIKWGVSTTQAYCPKDNSEYFDNCDYDLIDWMRQFSDDKRESYLRTFLGRMLFSGDDVYKQVKVLSGGEKVRCMLSRMMLSGANVLLFDQPTNHLDLESIAALNNGMSAFPYNIIFSSHDHQLTQTVANRIIDIQEDGTIIDRMCSYDDYMHLFSDDEVK